MDIVSKNELLKQFVGNNSDYYQKQFDKINASSGYVFTFNFFSALLGPVWFGARGLWQWCFIFSILEAFAFVQIVRGLFGDIAAEARARIESIEFTLNLRKEQLQEAIDSQANNVDVFRRTVESLENSIGSIRSEVAQIEASAIWVTLSGIVMLLVVKLIIGLLANGQLEKRFSDWLSDNTIACSVSVSRILTSLIFITMVYVSCALSYAFPGQFQILSEFPTTESIRLTGTELIKQFFDLATLYGEFFFDSIRVGIRVVLDWLELIFVSTPWIVIAGSIVLLTALTSGKQSAFFASLFLLYIGLFGFWEKAMTTLALLGTAACISISLGIPLGLFCARRPKFYAVIRPIMDFMQTMPSFVFMIPVIAFFSTGKPAAVIITMIFGGTPVVRLTVLGIQGVPQSVREAAISYGSSKWYLLRKIDLPLAAPSILAGINQTIMLSLAMVVVASLIGAKGLGEDVLEALQYASVGQGILAGFSILFCALILNRVMQGKK